MLKKMNNTDIKADGCLMQYNSIAEKLLSSHTVESRHLELGYLELCDARRVYLNQKYILIAYSNNNLASETFLQVQIT